MYTCMQAMSIREKNMNLKENWEENLKEMG